MSVSICAPLACRLLMMLSSYNSRVPSIRAPHARPNDPVVRLFVPPVSFIRTLIPVIRALIPVIRTPSLLLLPLLLFPVRGVCTGASPFVRSPRTHTHVHTHARTRPHACTQVQAAPRIHGRRGGRSRAVIADEVCIRAQNHARTHTHARAGAHAHTHTLHVLTQIRSRTHTTKQARVQVRAFFGDGEARVGGEAR
jgi:hypothetical protein